MGTIKVQNKCPDNHMRKKKYRRARTGNRPTPWSRKETHTKYRVSRMDLTKLQLSHRHGTWAHKCIIY